MTGAIIGDLAAWTWENDRDAFYRNLVTDDSELSVYGLTLLGMFENAMEEHDFDKFRTKLSKFILKHQSVLEDRNLWKADLLPYMWPPEMSETEISQLEYDSFFGSAREYFKTDDFISRIPVFISCIVLASWLPDSENAIREYMSKIMSHEKQCFYIRNIVPVISGLIHGKSKKQAVRNVENECMLSTLLEWYGYKGKPYWDDLMMYVSYAWNCFVHSWDFTSAIHNAMQCPGNKHLAGFLTGAIAEAMYGCRYRFIKKKYCDHQSLSKFIILPNSVRQQFAETLDEIQKYEKDHRHFFKKNDAMTNVERHMWTPFSVEDIPMELSEEYYRRMVKAYEPGWDCRFGVYLDDGWFYVYRSWVLLTRFKLIQGQNRQWKITNLQRCADDNHDPHEAMRSLLYSIMESWYDISGEHRSEYPSYCRYYHGEEACPFEYRSAKGKFWHGEMMFVKGGLDIEKWKLRADKLLPELTGKAMTLYRNMEPEQRALVLYIETLFSKWCPYDDMDWIFEY